MEAVRKWEESEMTGAKVRNPIFFNENAENAWKVKNVTFSMRMPRMPSQEQT